MTRSMPVAAALATALLAASPSHAADTAKMGNSSFGPLIPGGAACRLGQYLAGVDLFWAPSISNLRPFCGAMAPDGTWSGAPSIGSEVMATGGGVAGAGEGRRTLYCPRDYWVWGYKGHTQVDGINAVTELTLTCRNVKTGATTTVATPFKAGVSQVDWPASSCDRSSVAIGVFGSTHDNEIIQFGLGCGTTQPVIHEQRLLRAPGPRSMVVLPTPTPNPLLRAGALGASPAMAIHRPASQTFAPPVNKDGSRVYACETVNGVPCGQASADAFCKLQGFARAQSFANGLERVPAKTLSGQRCAALTCNVFSRIECAR